MIQGNLITNPDNLRDGDRVIDDQDDLGIIVMLDGVPYIKWDNPSIDASAAAGPGHTRFSSLATDLYWAVDEAGNRLKSTIREHRTLKRIDLERMILKGFDLGEKRALAVDLETVPPDQKLEIVKDIISDYLNDMK